MARHRLETPYVVPDLTLVHAMTLIHLDALPRNTTKGTIVRLLVQVGEIDKRKLGAIQIQGRSAMVEVPESWADRLVRALDGADLANGYVRAWRPRPNSGTGEEDPFDRMMRLLEVEARAEAEQVLLQSRRTTPQQAEQSGNSLIDLDIWDEHAGLGGRHLVTLGKRDSSQPLPWTRLSVGSPVLLSQQRNPKSKGIRGVVSARTSHRIQVALDVLPETEVERTSFRIDLSSDEIARVRQRQALQRAQAAQGCRLADLREILLGAHPASFLDSEDPDLFNPDLNDSQREAVAMALAAKDIAIIHGPPGTGKTTTVVELVRQSVQRGDKVLVCAPSNTAVDNLLEQLVAAREQAVRVGHPARVAEALRQHTLDLMVEAHPDLKLARKLVKQARAHFDKASRYTRAKPAAGAKRELRDEARELLADARRLERQVVAEVLDRATIVCSTTTALDSEILGQRTFDLAVIDEACQSTEPGCWIPLLRADRLVLAGDHCQLPPTVVAVDAVREGFGVSLLERLMKMTGSAIARRLNVQYRMHQQIMEFASRQFYDSSLIADASVRQHRLCDLPGVPNQPWTQQPIEFIDTAGASYDEQLEPDGESRLNPQEADLVVQKVRQHHDAGLRGDQLAVIAPYAAQVRLLRSLLNEFRDVEVDSVDGFQGREKEAVIISLVRSNPNGEIGFLADTRRMNVAMTRARRKLTVIGDSATIAAHPFYESMLAYFDSIGAYRSVWEEWA